MTNTPAAPTTPLPRRREIWGIAARSSASKALVLLAVEELAQGCRPLPGVYEDPVDEEHPLDPAEVAAFAGVSLTVAENALRSLADDDEAVRKVWRLAFDPKKPKASPRARVAYLPASTLPNPAPPRPKKGAS